MMPTGYITMAWERPHQQLIERLSRGLVPVERFGRPSGRIVGWVALVGTPAAALAAVTDPFEILHRHMVDPALALAMVGSIGSAVTAAAAAVLSALPDRDRRWSLLPMPSVCLWIGASLFGTANGGGQGVTPSLAEACACFGFILGFGIPFAVMLVGMLRGSYALRPAVTAGLAGLASASAAASVLGLIHPFAMAINDLGMHALAVATLSGACAGLGKRFLHPHGSRTP